MAGAKGRELAGGEVFPDRRPRAAAQQEKHRRGSDSSAAAGILVQVDIGSPRGVPAADCPMGLPVS